MLRFSLYDLNGVGVVVALPTGVIYSNQTGGSACLQPELEGAFLPVNSQHEDGDPQGLEAQLTGLFVSSAHFDEKLADRVDAVLRRFDETHGISVDRMRYGDSHEAWIFVMIQQMPSGTLRGVEGPLAGVLTWTNSD